jgi:hypothetical protein
MKLELKHLDFANNSKVRLTRVPHWDFENVSLQDCELAFNSVSKEPFLRYKNVTFGLNQTSLYKRPLSDLTKEIEVNGEKFVPMEWMEKNIHKMVSFYEPIDKSSEIEIDIMTEDYSQRISLYDGFRVIQKFQEWHFDYQRLIENGLAIDINTLQS